MSKSEWFPQRYVERGKSAFLEEAYRSDVRRPRVHGDFPNAIRRGMLFDKAQEGGGHPPRRRIASTTQR